MFWGAERVLIFRTLIYFPSTPGCVFSYLPKNFNQKAIIVHSVKAVQKFIFEKVGIRIIIIIIIR